MLTIHKEGRTSVIVTFILLLIVIASLFIFWGVNIYSMIISISLCALFAFVAYFFREPRRELALSAPNDIMAAADGKVVLIKEVYEGEYLNTKCIQLSIFMSVFNVHINYFPIDGTIEYYKYHPGSYLVAWHEKSSEKNERSSVVIKTQSGEQILLRQIAGYLARRVVCYAKEGTCASKGEQLGFIKFGSRVDYFLPLNSKIKVAQGDVVKACQSVVATIGE